MADVALAHVHGVSLHAKGYARTHLPSCVKLYDIVIGPRFAKEEVRRTVSVSSYRLLTGHCFCAFQMVYRAKAEVGRRVYWLGSGIRCMDPELLEIGDDVRVAKPRYHFQRYVIQLSIDLLRVTYPYSRN
jgi:hypothetical protein